MNLPDPRKALSYTERNIACAACIHGENAQRAVQARDDGDGTTARHYAKEARRFLVFLKSWGSADKA